MNSDTFKINKKNYIEKLGRDISINKSIYIMAIPIFVYYLLFHYGPMYGAIIAFKDFSPAKGILGSEWAGLKHFIKFFNSYYFERICRNTFLINVYNLFFGFPAPIILALLLNELQMGKFKRLVQTISYMPHFLPMTVVAGMIINFTGRYGVINDIIVALGGQRSNLMLRSDMFRTIYVSSGIWQEIGWGSIIYLAALTNIDPQLYEASVIDGAGRLGQIWHITLPGILPTILILLILQIGQMMNVGFEKIILLYNASTYETGDVISSFVYRKGLLEFDYSYSAAVGLFNSVINFSLLLCANRMSRKLTETSLW